MKTFLITSSITFVLLSFTFCNVEETPQSKTLIKRTIQIKGSDTEYLMVKDLADAYMNEHPEIKIIVEGGGSNKGIESLMENNIDICNSSREISSNEIQTIKTENVNPLAIIFSVDALAIITNYKVGVDSLSSDQITKLFAGKIKNWKELGGDDLNVRLYGRNKASGTREYFLKKFLPDSKDLNIKECSSNEEVLESVMKNIGALGYVGAGFLFDKTGKPNGKIWAMPIYIDNHMAVSPYQTEAVKKGEYILTRPLYQYVNGVPDEYIQDFILFELTKRGQDIVMKHGFFPINDHQTQINRLKGLIN